jgi:periplasmic copper chaperone A
MRKSPICLAMIVISVATPSFAHVVFTNPEVVAGQRSSAGLIITHGCNGTPTTRISITIPEGVTRVLPRALAGWRVSVEKRPLATPIMLHGERVTEVTSKITWSGGSLEDGSYEEFDFRYSAPNAAGQTLYFPVEQLCQTGSYSWSKVPAAGQSWGSLDTPAPFIKVIPATGQSHGHH